MQTLSLKSYVWKCGLGLELAYAVCLGAGYLPIRTEAGRQLHHTLFETLPGFVWGRPSSIVLGAFEMLIIAGIFGTYYVWMHNSSLVGRSK
jgi:hypothetical protein